MRKIDDLRYDLVCVGGGISGVFAAISAARLGAHVLVLERTGMLGGMAALGGAMSGISCRSVLLKDFFSILGELGGLVDDEAVLAADGDAVRLALFRLCRESGVDVLLYSEAYGVMTHGERVSGLRAAGKGAMLEIETPAIVDATGMGELLRSAGVQSAEAPMQAWAAMILAGLDPVMLCRLREAAEVQKGFTQRQPGAAYRGPLYEGSPVCKVSVCVEPGRCLVEFPVEGRVEPWNPLSRTQAIREAHLSALHVLERLRREPEFETVNLSCLPPQIRMVPYGSMQETKESPEEGWKPYFPNRVWIAKRPAGLIGCNVPIKSDQNSGSKVYAPEACQNREEMAALSWRNSAAAAFETGEAAGICAALAVQRGCMPGEIDEGIIRDRMGCEGRDCT